MLLFEFAFVWSYSNQVACFEENHSVLLSNLPASDKKFPVGRSSGHVKSTWVKQ